MTITKNLNDASASSDGDLRDLMQKNLQLSEEMHVIMKKMDRFIFWSRVGGYLKFILIFLPLILSYFLLSPLLKSAFSQYQDILGNSQGLDMKSLPPELQNLMPKK